MRYGPLVPWNEVDADAMSLDTGLSFVGEESLTVQSQKEDADINVIMARYGMTGNVPAVPLGAVPTYGDFDTGVTDYRSALHVIRDAQEAFAALDVKVRNRFNNDPAEFLDYVMADGRTRKDLQEIGLEVPDVEEAPQKVQVVSMPEAKVEVKS